MSTEDILTVRKELRGLKQVEAIASTCIEEHIASRGTVYTAIDPSRFNIKNVKHRMVLRRAIRFLQERGLFLEWSLDEVLPESIRIAV